MGMLMQFAGSRQERLLTEEGAAEYLWTAFIEPLQR